MCLLTLMYQEGPSNKGYCALALVISGVVCCIFRFSKCSSLSQQISKAIEDASATLKKILLLIYIPPIALKVKQWVKLQFRQKGQRSLSKSVV